MAKSWQKHGKIHYEKMKNNVTYVYMYVFYFERDYQLFKRLPNTLFRT